MFPGYFSTVHLSKRCTSVIEHYLINSYRDSPYDHEKKNASLSQRRDISACGDFAKFASWT